MCPDCLTLLPPSRCGNLPSLKDVAVIPRDPAVDRTMAAGTGFTYTYAPQHKSLGNPWDKTEADRMDTRHPNEHLCVSVHTRTPTSSC